MGGDSPDEDVELLRQAQEWHQNISGARVADQDAFAHWLLASPRHIEAFLRITMIERELGGTDLGTDDNLWELARQSIRATNK